MRKTLDNFTSLKLWMSPSTKRFWLVVVVVAYTLIGFFIAPYVARQQLATVLSETLQRPVTINNVRVNPYALSATVEEFTLKEADGSSIASFDRLYIDFELISLFNRAWTFREITLENPDVSILRNASGSFNIMALAPPKDPAPAIEESTGIPPLLFHSLNLTGGKLRFADQTKQPSYTTTVAPVDLHFRELGTRQGDTGQHSIELYGKSGTSLKIDGELSISPLLINGDLRLSGPFLPLAYEYFKDQLNVQVTDGDLALAMGFSVSESGKNYIIKLNSDELSVNHLKITDMAQSADMLSLEKISLADFKFTWPEKTLAAGGLTLENGNLSLVREENGSFNWQKIAAANSASTPNTENSPEPADSPEPIDSPEPVDSPEPADSPEPIESPEPPDSPEQQTAAVTEDSNTGTSTDTRVKTSDQTTDLGDTSIAKTEMQPVPETELAGISLLPDWNLSLGKVSVQGFKTIFRDQTLRTPATLIISDLGLDIENLSNTPGATFPAVLSATLAESGNLDYQGELTLIPDWKMNGELKITALSLPALDPYLGNYLNARLKTGSFTATSKIESSAITPFTLSADLEIDQLDIEDTAKERPLLQWQRLDVKNLNIGTTPVVISAGAITLDKPYARFRINEDKTTNVQQLVVEQSPATDSELADDNATLQTAPSDTTTAPDPLKMSMNQLVINDATIDFADYTLPIPFDNRLSNLNGEINDFSTAGKTPATLKLQGKVGKYGSVKISGSLSPWDVTASTDIALKMQNVDMPNLEPYSIKFVGRKIESGKMNLDLDYKLDNGQLKGSNSVVLTTFELGPKVPQEGALDLPLGLAVALLKGPDGNIEIDLPVSGDTNNPEFSIGSIILKVFANLITKAVTAPFKLLGALVGAGEDDFDTLFFEPGSAEILPPQQEKLDKLVEALEKRPLLGIEIKGVVAPQADRAALQNQRLDTLIEAGRVEKYGEDSNRPRSEQQLDVMQTMFEKAYDKVRLDTLQEKFPFSEDGIRPDAYITSLRSSLLETIDVDPETLNLLGQQRARNIQTTLTADNTINQQRITTAERETMKKAGKKGVPLKLEVRNAK